MSVCASVCAFLTILPSPQPDKSFTSALVFMTYLCVFEGVSSSLFLSVCVCVCAHSALGHVQTCLVSGQMHWLWGRNTEEAVVSVGFKEAGLKVARAAKQTLWSPRLAQSEGSDASDELLEIRDSRQVNVCSSFFFFPFFFYFFFFFARIKQREVGVGRPAVSHWLAYIGRGRPTFEKLGASASGGMGRMFGDTVLSYANWLPSVDESVCGAAPPPPASV